MTFGSPEQEKTDKKMTYVLGNIVRHEKRTTRRTVSVRKERLKTYKSFCCHVSTSSFVHTQALLRNSRLGRKELGGRRKIIEKDEKRHHKGGRQRK